MNLYIKITLLVICGICILLPITIMHKLNSDFLLRNLYFSLTILGIIFLFMYRYYPNKDEEGNIIYNNFYLEIGILTLVPGILGAALITYNIIKKKKVKLTNNVVNLYNKIINSRMKL